MCSGPDAVRTLATVSETSSIYMQSVLGSPALGVLNHLVSLWHQLPDRLWHVFRPWAALLWTVSSVASLYLLLDLLSLHVYQ